MQTSKLAKKILIYLPLLAVAAAVVMGMWLAKNLYQQLSIDSQITASAQLPTEQGTPPLLVIPEAGPPCASPNEIYTSFPPKCRTMDGGFTQIPGTFPVFEIPKGK